MFGGSSSKKTDGISKSRPGPKVGSKRDPYAARPGPKRMMDQPNLSQQRLDQMSLFKTRSRSEQDQSISTFNNDNVDSTINTSVAEGTQNTQMEIVLDEEVIYWIVDLYIAYDTYIII